MEQALVSENMTDQKSTIMLLFPPSLFPNHETKHFEDVFTVKTSTISYSFCAFDPRITDFILRKKQIEFFQLKIQNTSFQSTKYIGPPVCNTWGSPVIAAIL